MNSTIIKVTPDMAKDWLKRCNTKNRRISKSHVTRIASEMKSGRWCLNGETIVFDQNMNLIDGQHRLSAIVESNTEIDLLVVNGVDDDRAFKTTGTLLLKRNSSQIAEMMGVTKYTTIIVGASRILYHYENSTSYEEFVSMSFIRPSGSNIPADIIADFSKEMSASLSCIYSKYYSAFRATCAPATALALFYIMQKSNPVSTHALFEKIASGIFEDRNDPAKLLHDQLIKNRFPIKNKKAYMAAILIKTFNAMYDNKSVKQLKWITSGAAPEKFPSIRGISRY